MNKIDEITKYVLYLKDKKMKVLPPDINKSRAVFKVEKDGVRFGLSALKGAGQVVIDNIIKERETNGYFKSFPDFISRCIDDLNTRLIEGLIYAGAFDEFGVPRSQLAEVYDGLCSRAKVISKQKNSMQMNLFGDFIEEEEPEVKYPNIPELDINEKLAKEKEAPEEKKKIYYISAEFLIGKLLSNNMINLGIYDEVDALLKESGKSLAELEEIEPEPSLGNGGLGTSGSLLPGFSRNAGPAGGRCGVALSLRAVPPEFPESFSK